jgi:hypothetical protein
LELPKDFIVVGLAMVWKVSKSNGKSSRQYIDGLKIKLQDEDHFIMPLNVKKLFN